MGDPRKARRTYQNPKKPWDKSRLDEERVLVRDYGIANKTEIYKMQALLRKFALQAKNLISISTAQGEQERKALISKLQSLSLINVDAQLDDVLALELKNIMERRLQTLVLRKGLANTVKQARQFIVHKHIKVGNKVITSPSYIVSKSNEATISFVDKSSLANPAHPERPESIFALKNAKKKKEEMPAVEVKEEVKKVEAEVAKQ